MAEEIGLKPWWSPIVHAFTHALVGTAIFIIIAAAAVLLGVFVKWLELFGVSTYVVGVLTLLEYAIVTIDAAGYLVYLVNTGYQAWKEL